MRDARAVRAVLAVILAVPLSLTGVTAARTAGAVAYARLSSPLNRDLDFWPKMAVEGIPVVDFSVMSLENKNPLSEDDPAIRDLADQVYQAFSTIGFVYLKNHGIAQEMVSGHFNDYFPVTYKACLLRVISIYIFVVRCNVAEQFIILN